MKAVLFVFLLISTILTIYVVYSYKYGSREGFQSSENPLLSLVGNLKRINAYLIDPKTLIERVEMSRMSPVELARRELNKPK